jgi:hypothetical protein
MKSIIIVSLAIFILVVSINALADPRFLTLPFDGDRTILAGWFYSCPDDDCNSENCSEHQGIDYELGYLEPILAAHDGVAMTSQQDPESEYSFGIFVRIKDNNGYETMYAHLDHAAPGIQSYPEDQRWNNNFDEWTPVVRGQIIGYCGDTGTDPGNYHLHFAVQTTYASGEKDPYGVYCTQNHYPGDGLSVDYMWTAFPPSHAQPPSECYVAFFDDFEDGDAVGWHPVGYGSWSVENGQYRLALEAGKWGMSLAGNPAWTDYTLEADVVVEGGSDVNFWVRSEDIDGQYAGNLYSIAIRGEPANDVVLLKYEQHTEVWRQYFTRPPESWPSFHISITVAGNQITVVLNGSVVIDYTDAGADLIQGNIGVGGYNVRVRFDNIRVTGPSDILPSIVLKAPNDGVLLKSGGQTTISWRCLGPNVDHIRILYSTDGGANYSEGIVGNAPNTGTYLWTVPDAVVQDASIQVQTEAADNTVLAVDKSDKTFPILGYNVAFFDDFEDGDDVGWYPGLGTWIVENGKYVLDCDGSQQSGRSVAGNVEWTDYTIEADVQGVYGTDKHIWFREKDWSNAYIAVLRSNPGNDIVLLKFEEGTEQWREYYPLPYQVDNGVWYHVSVSVIGDRIQVKIDDDLVVDYTDVGTSLTHGRIGVGGYVSSGHLRTEFDNVQVESSSAPNQSLVAYWSFDDGHVEDNSGNGHDGTIHGAVAVPGVSANALHFDGIDDYISVPHSSALQPSSEITVAAWVKPQGFYTGYCQSNDIVCKGYTGLVGSYVLRYLDYDDCNVSSPEQQRFAFHIRFNEETFVGPLSNTVVQLGQWYHAAGTYDGNVMKIFVNGNLEGSEPISLPLGANTFDLTIGRMNHDVNPYWVNGTIDEIYIYNRALDDNEIRELYSKHIFSCEDFEDLFCDDFEDGVNPEWVQTGDPCTWTVMNGTYHASLNGTYLWSNQNVGADDWADYTVECNVRGNAGHNKILKVRNRSDESCYIVNLRSDWNNADELRLLKRIPGGELVELRSVQYPSQNGVWYHLQISCINEQILISVDGNTILTHLDLSDPILSGGIALSCFTGASLDCDISFDNVKVWGGVLNQPPVADAGGPHIDAADEHVYFGSVGQPITLDGSGSSDPDGQVDIYEWQWFDGDSWHNEGSHPTHTYDYAGTYEVALKVTDNDGATDIDYAQAIVIDGWIFIPGTYDVLCPEGAEDICGTGCLAISYDLADGWGDAACNIQTGFVMASAETFNPEISAAAIHGGIFQVDDPTWARAQVLMSSVGGKATLGERFSGTQLNLVHCIVTDLQNMEMEVIGTYPSDIDPPFDLDFLQNIITTILQFFVPGWIGDFFDAVGILSFVEDYIALQQAENGAGEDLEWNVNRTEPILLEPGTHYFVAGLNAWTKPGIGYACARRAGTMHFIFIERCDPGEVGDDMRVTGLCPIKLVVTDPTGRSIDEDTSSIPGAAYFRADFNFDGDVDCSIHIPSALDGDYSITVVPEPGADSTNEFSLLINYGGRSWFLAEDITISDISEEPYGFWTIPVGSISGTVSDSIGGLSGVTVDLFDSTGMLAQFTYADSSGFFEFDSVSAGMYAISIVTPLGYVADFESRPITVTWNADSVVNFTLHALEIIPSQRSMGYWKHQVNVHLSGKGNAQESLAEMSSYMGLVEEHFNNHPTNPITIFEVPQPADQTDSLEVLQELLTVKGNAGMNAKARQQLTALMLNVVSLKLHQTTLISEDNATVSQAITYCNQLITDLDSTNDETAKDITDQINNGLSVASGIIPLATPNIAYRGGTEQMPQLPNAPKEFSLGQNYPNPFNPICEIEYALPIDCQVTLTIYNILGQKVRVLVDEYQSAGHKSVTWDGKDDQGQEVTTGVYFYRIQAGDFAQSKKMVLMK